MIKEVRSYLEHRIEVKTENLERVGRELSVLKSELEALNGEDDKVQSDLIKAGKAASRKVSATKTRPTKTSPRGEKKDLKGVGKVALHGKHRTNSKGTAQIREGTEVWRFVNLAVRGTQREFLKDLLGKAPTDGLTSEEIISIATQAGRKVNKSSLRAEVRRLCTQTKEAVYIVQPRGAYKYAASPVVADS